MGYQTPDKNFVERTTSKTVIELVAGKPPHESLIQPMSQDTDILRDDFVIGKF